MPFGLTGQQQKQVFLQVTGSSGMENVLEQESLTHSGREPGGSLLLILPPGVL